MAARRLPQPQTLSDQASYSERETQLLMHLAAAARPLRAPADEARALRSFSSALASAISYDGFVADAAKAQDGEGVAYWLSKRVAAINQMKKWSRLLDASACAP